MDLEKVEVFRRTLDAAIKPTESVPAGPSQVAAGDERRPEAQRDETSIKEGERPPPPAAVRLAPESPSTAPPFLEGAILVATLESKTPGEPLSYRDPWDPSWKGKRLEYAVRHVNRKGKQSGLSPVAQIEPIPPISAPAGLHAEVGDRVVRVVWRSELPEGGSPELSFAYNVLRRGKAAPYAETPLNSTPVTATSFEDPKVEFGQEWCYAVRKVAVPTAAVEGESPGPVIESRDSEEVCVTPVDSFAPPVPAGVVAVRSEQGIFLSWAVVETSDLKGYLVYRAEQPEGPFERLTDPPIDVPSFTDRTAEPTKVYFYAVSAVDGAEPPNESEKSAPVAVRAAARPPSSGSGGGRRR